jgi:hypothetical protein
MVRTTIPLSGFEFFCFGKLFPTQYAFCTHVFAIAWTTIFGTKQIPEKITGRAGDQNEKAG